MSIGVRHELDRIFAPFTEIVEGLTTLGLDPRRIKYVLISHAHGDHDQGAALLQSRYGAKVVMGTADWEATLERPASAPGGVPKRDVAVGPEGTKVTLGDTTVDVIATPGHTPARCPSSSRSKTQGARSSSPTPAARHSTSRGERRTLQSTETARTRWRRLLRPRVRPS
jgi:metallo-beta-lactamase class B